MVRSIKEKTPRGEGRQERGKERGRERKREKERTGGVYQVMMPLSSSSSMVGSSETLPLRRGNLHRPEGGREGGREGGSVKGRRENGE